MRYSQHRNRVQRLHRNAGQPVALTARRTRIRRLRPNQDKESERSRGCLGRTCPQLTATSMDSIPSSSMRLSWTMSTTIRYRSSTWAVSWCIVQLTKALGSRSERTWTHPFSVREIYFVLGDVADGPREQTGSRGRSYDYALPLPTLDHEKRGPITYPEWGWPLQTSDLDFFLRDLEEFESTNLDDLFVSRVSEKASRRPRPISEASHTTSKRRKLDTSTPLDIIPKVSRSSLQITCQYVTHQSIATLPPSPIENPYFHPGPSILTISQDRAFARQPPHIVHGA